MRKPRTLIVDDDSELLAVLSSKFKSLGHEVKAYPYIGENQLNDIKTFDLVILDQWIRGKRLGKPDLKGDDIARRLKDDKAIRNIPIVLITGASITERAILAEEALRSGLFKEVIGKPLYENDLERIASYPIIPLNIGFVSLGRLAQKSIEILFKEHPEYVETVKGVSLTGMHKEENLKRVLNIEDEPRFKVYSSLEELIEQNCDIVLISSSNNAESRIKNGRNWLWNNEKALQYDIWTRIIKKEKEMLLNEKSANSFYIIATNPIGMNISLAEKLGLPAERITGLSVIDTIRAKKWLKQRYFEQFNGQLDDNDFSVRVIGQHGLEIPIYDSIRIKGKSPEEIGFKIDMNKFTDDIRSEGGKIMESVKNLSRADMQETLYRGVPEAFVRLIGTLCRREQPVESLYTKRNVSGALHLNGPSKIFYSENGITIQPKEIEAGISKSEFSRLIKQCEEEYEFQHHEVDSYIRERKIIK